MASETEYVLIGLFFFCKAIVIFISMAAWVVPYNYFTTPLAVKPLDVFSDTKVMILLAGLSLASHYIVKAGTLHCCK